MGVLVDTQETVLNNVVGRQWVTRDDEGRPIHPPLVALVQHTQHVKVAGLKSVDQLTIGGRNWHPSIPVFRLLRHPDLLWLLSPIFT